MNAVTSQTRPIVWTIGGSDSGGGAGIQADVLTIQDLGCHACTVISAITAQNSMAVSQIEPTTTQLLLAQLQMLATDLPPKVIKISQLATLAQVELLSEWLSQHKANLGCTVIWDPVLDASSGQRLSNITPAVCTRLLQWVDIVTPNWPEVAFLLQRPLHELAPWLSDPSSDIRALWQTQYGHWQGWLVIKGGHAGDPQKVLDRVLQVGVQKVSSVGVQQVSAFSDYVLQSKRLHTPHQHGTGCTFASALAAVLAQGYDLADAMVVARAYLQQALRLGYATGQGAGSLGHAGWPLQTADFPALIMTAELAAQPALPQAALPQAIELDAVSHVPDRQLSAQISDSAASLDLTPAWQFAKLRHPLGLYPVVDDIQWLTRLLPLGLSTIQLRLKQLPQAELERQIAQAIRYCRDFDIQLFINDHWQLAIKYQAFGVHLGQEDLAEADLAAIAKAGLRLGISTHGYAELAKVMPMQPSYLALGHVFATQTKQMPSQPQGLQRLAHYVKLCGDIPTVAIGGIKLEHIANVLATGVQGIAVVSAITQAPEPEKALLQLKQACQRGATFQGELYGAI